MFISASIVIFETNKKDLIKAISSVINSCIDTLYIIDNSPTDILREFVKGPKVEYIFGHGNIGYGAGHNIAIKKTINNGYNYHIVINPDVEFYKETVEKMSDYMNTHSEVGLMMPKVFFPNGEVQYLCKLLPTPFDWIFRRFMPFSILVKRQNKKFELRHTGYNKIMNVPYLSGCFMFFRIDALKDVGLFDEKIFMYGEDTDITRRIHQKYQTLFYPQVSIIHRFNKKSYSDFRLLCIHIKSAIYYFNKWGWICDSERRRINNSILSEVR
ncbi:MAG: glycosyltransferase family 2 protein [Bacteroidales bacterium]|jgi:GT2 family glycosyltransferase|nr:glycosyltransferase family 2 protein [Bacteroidales bacterium]